jgi:hypothetical protein
VTRTFSPASMSVYSGMIAVGRIVEIARREVEAFRVDGDGERFLGKFPTRQEAMRAVSAAGGSAHGV